MIYFLIICGIISICASLIAIIAVVLTKHEISSLLNKDKILFNENFVAKQKVLEESMALADDVIKRGKALCLNPEFSTRATNCLNSLMCVVSNMKLIDCFSTIVKDVNAENSKELVEDYKLLCRKDLGFKTRKNKNKKIEKVQPTDYAQKPANPQVSTQQNPPQTRPATNLTQQRVSIPRPPVNSSQQNLNATNKSTTIKQPVDPSKPSNIR